jgi:hypothetical protein
MAAEESRKGDNVALKRKEETQVVPAYEPTPQEQAVAKTYFAKREQRAPCPGLKVSDKSVTVDHPDGKLGWLLLTQALGAEAGK